MLLGVVSNICCFQPYLGDPIWLTCFNWIETTNNWVVFAGSRKAVNVCFDVFFFQKNRKKSLPKQFEICSGQITSAPNKPPVEISNEMLVVKCSKGIPPQNALKIFVFLNWSHLPSWYRMIYKISTILPQFCYIGSDPSDFVFLQDNVWYWIHGLLEMALQNGLST